jgi:hypothetical protein
VTNVAAPPLSAPALPLPLVGAMLVQLSLSTHARQLASPRPTALHPAHVLRLQRRRCRWKPPPALGAPLPPRRCLRHARQPRLGPCRRVGSPGAPALAAGVDHDPAADTRRRGWRSGSLSRRGVDHGLAAAKPELPTSDAGNTVVHDRMPVLLNTASVEGMAPPWGQRSARACAR